MDKTNTSHRALKTRDVDAVFYCLSNEVGLRGIETSFGGGSIRAQLPYVVTAT
jgi:hypothetical protein